jgi:hypothetical protein
VDHRRLRPVLARANDPTELRQMILDVGLGWCDQGFEPQAFPIRVFARLVFPHPILADVESQQVHSGLITFQGVADLRFVDVQRQSHPRQPGYQELLTVIEN